SPRVISLLTTLSFRKRTVIVVLSSFQTDSPVESPRRCAPWASTGSPRIPRTSFGDMPSRILSKFSWFRREPHAARHSSRIATPIERWTSMVDFLHYARLGLRTLGYARRDRASIGGVPWHSARQSSAPWLSAPW